LLRFLLLALLLCVPGLGRAAAPHTVAVLYFENGGGDAFDALKVGLAQLLINDLVGAEGLKVVERTDLQKILDELELGHSGVADPETAAKVGKLLGAEWLVLGTYFEMGGILFVQSRIVRVETGEILAAHALQDEPADFLVLQQALSTAWKGTLGALVATAAKTAPAASATAAATPAATRAGSAAPAPAVAPAASAPPTVAAPDAGALEAAIAYSEGLIFLDSRDVPRAREAFERAVATDPRLADARAHLASLDL
jgi:TolB-like protein